MTSNLKQLIFSLTTDESCRKGLRFQPRPSDAIVCGPPKCGTTWLQQIVHQLRTGGDMDFPGIYSVVPWIEAACDANLDLDAKQKAKPRLYKTHVGYEHVPKTCKYIVVYRDPCATAYSFFRFIQGVLFQPGTLSFEDFVTSTWLAFGNPENPVKPYDVSYLSHLLSWMEHRHDPNVLLLFYEEMKEDLETTVRAVASFLDIQDENKISAAIQMSSFDFMKANAEKFSATVPTPPSMRESTGPYLSFEVVRQGSATEAKDVVSHEVNAFIQQRWEKEVTGATGYKNYEDLRIGVRKERPLAR